MTIKIRQHSEGGLDSNNLTKLLAKQQVVLLCHVIDEEFMTTERGRHWIEQSSKNLNCVNGLLFEVH